MSEMRLCLCNTNAAWGGGEKWTLETARRCRDAGLTVVAVCRPGSELALRLSREPDITLATLPISSLSLFDPVTMLRLVRLFRRERIEALVTVLPADLKAAGVAAKLAGVPRIVSRRGIAAPVKNRFLNRLLYRRVLTRLIVNSEQTRRMVLAENPHLLPPERIFKVPNAFDIDAWDAEDDTPRFAPEGSQIVIGNAARLTPQKGQDLLLRAAALLAERGRDFCLLVAGTGPERKRLEALARELGVAERVVFSGFVRRMKAFHASLDIFALSSRFEGFCYAMVEAMACRTPVVALDASSNPEVLGGGGLLVPPDDPAAFADALQRLMDDAALRTRLGKSGRALVEEHYRAETVFERFLQVLDVR